MMENRVGTAAARERSTVNITVHPMHQTSQSIRIEVEKNLKETCTDDHDSTTFDRQQFIFNFAAVLNGKWMTKKKKIAFLSRS